MLFCVLTIWHFRRILLFMMIAFSTPLWEGRISYDKFLSVPPPPAHSTPFFLLTRPFFRHPSPFPILNLIIARRESVGLGDLNYLFCIALMNLHSTFTFLLQCAQTQAIPLYPMPLVLSYLSFLSLSIEIKAKPPEIVITTITIYLNLISSHCIVHCEAWSVFCPSSIQKINGISLVVTSKLFWENVCFRKQMGVISLHCSFLSLLKSCLDTLLVLAENWLGLFAPVKPNHQSPI
jgi:hypothetical protein